MSGDVRKFVILYFGIIIQSIWNEYSNIKQNEIQFFIHASHVAKVNIAGRK